ncbi:YgfZ/GcvT domain-containing protein [Halorhodospira neutriphila]|uniref:Folate-binding protein YgfZ n=1 Tax=Halorhodospira neutriphila TaxID=168379 RepID=A0ABS1E2L5_9GAMM|nr:folate-binding protein YgfZ [Halorhodospira neutriphila]MBK1725943.1 hypothetical protein [Halorhodospira neutriphila]
MVDDPLPQRPLEAWGDGSGYGILAVAGAEAHDFLQRILTADIPPPGAPRTALAGLCTPQGRLAALARVVPWGDGYRLILPADGLTDTAQRLRRYVLRSRVEVTEGPDDAQLAQAAGDKARARLAARGALPAEPGGTAPCGEALLVRLPHAPERYWLLGAAAALADALAEIRAALPEAGPEAWRLAEIAAGIPEVRAGGREQFLPQGISLDLLGGVSFSKGCFPGQEVIARTHYRGRVKQRLYRAAGAGRPPEPGAPVRDEEQERAGAIVTAAPDRGGGFAALASLRPEAAAARLWTEGGELAGVEPVLDEG